MLAYKPWRPLVAGDIVDIVAPSARWPGGDLALIEQLLRSWGLVPRIPDNLYGNDLLCANSDEERLAQLKFALLESESAAVWCLRGGYGATRLLPELMKLPAPSHSKLFIGLSDITALHVFLQNQWSWQTLHGPSASQIVENKIDQQDIADFKLLIFGQSPEVTINLFPLNTNSRCGEITAPIIGGNLAIVQASLGTPWQINTANKILFLEDVNERAYRIDRMLVQLLQAEILKEVAAIIFGDFIGGAELDGSSLVQPALARFAQTLAIPVFKCSGIGHGFHNKALPLGSPAVIQIGKTVSQLKISSNFRS